MSGQWEVAKPLIVQSDIVIKKKTLFVHISLCVTVIGNWLLGGQHIQASKRTHACSLGHDLHLTPELLIQLSYYKSSWSQRRPKPKRLQPTRNSQIPWSIFLLAPGAGKESQKFASPLHPLPLPPRAYPWVLAAVWFSSIWKSAKGPSQNSHLPWLWLDSLSQDYCLARVRKQELP